MSRKNKQQYIKLIKHVKKEIVVCTGQQYVYFLFTFFFFFKWIWLFILLSAAV